jgi:hypothetical protein
MILGTILLGVALSRIVSGPGVGWFPRGSFGWWAVTLTLRLPYLIILLFVVGGLIERVGFFWRGRTPQPPGRLPAVWPTVCVQLPHLAARTVKSR